MELVVPWKALLKLIEPHYPDACHGRQALRAGIDAARAPDAEPVRAVGPGDGEALYEIASLRTIIAAPSSTKNAQGERDPDLHQTKKGKQRFFGMKAHIAVDADCGLVHTVTTTAANEADVEQVATCCTARKKRCGPTRFPRSTEPRAPRRLAVAHRRPSE